MKLRHSFHVFVDNFSITYKLLIFRLVIGVVMTVIGVLCLYPFVTSLINSESFTTMFENLENFIANLLNGQTGELQTFSENIRQAFDQFSKLLQTRINEIILSGLLILLLYILGSWLSGIGNYTTAVIINDKMALRAKSPFFGTMISHFKQAAIYNLIYVPLSVLYDVIVFIGLFAALHFMLMSLWFFLALFLFTLMTILLLAVKMTFTCDWLPAIIRGKMGQIKSISYSFSRKGKDTFNIFSNFLVILVIIMALNVAAFLFTFGVGLLLTIPATYIIIISFEFVNYYDREDLRYFVDKYTIIKPDRERVLTREEFFKGADNDGE